MKKTVNHGEGLIGLLPTDVAAVPLLKLDHQSIGHGVST